jgi:hypothetical protein
LVSGQKGGAGYNSGANGEGGLLIIQVQSYHSNSVHWNLDSSTHGNHPAGTTNGGHGVVTGNPQKVFVQLVSPPAVTQHPQSLTNFPEATGSTLILTNLQTSHAGVYSVVVTDLYGLAISSNAVLTVLPPRPRISLASLTVTNRQFQFTLQGGSGRNIEIRSTTNLEAPSPIGFCYPR